MANSLSARGAITETFQKCVQINFMKSGSFKLMTFTVFVQFRKDQLGEGASSSTTIRLKNQSQSDCNKCII